MFQLCRLRAVPAHLCLLLGAVLLAVGCNRVPALDETQGAAMRHTDYPTLIPLEPALALHAAEPNSAEQLEREMDWRRARLEARAARLRAAQAD